MENSTQPEKLSKTRTIIAGTLVIGVLTVGITLLLNGWDPPDHRDGLSPGTKSSQQESGKATQSSAHPRLLDLGATKCIPCKKMAPILEELKREYEGRLDVEFVDVWRMPSVANQYGVQAIPTQIFFDVSGKELYRHQGFFAKEEILSKWDELGIDLKK